MEQENFQKSYANVIPKEIFGNFLEKPIPFTSYSQRFDGCVETEFGVAPGNCGAVVMFKCGWARPTPAIQCRERLWPFRRSTIFPFFFPPPSRGLRTGSMVLGLGLGTRMIGQPSYPNAARI